MVGIREVTEVSGETVLGILVSKLSGVTTVVGTEGTMLGSDGFVFTQPVILIMPISKIKNITALVVRYGVIPLEKADNALFMV